MIDHTEVSSRQLVLVANFADSWKTGKRLKYRWSQQRRAVGQWAWIDMDFFFFHSSRCEFVFRERASILTHQRPASDPACWGKSPTGAPGWRTCPETAAWILSAAERKVEHRCLKSGSEVVPPPPHRFPFSHYETLQRRFCSLCERLTHTPILQNTELVQNGDVSSSIVVTLL